MQFFLDMWVFLLSLTLGCSEGCYTVLSWWPRKQCQAELITLMGKTKLHKKVSNKLQVNHISKVMLNFDSRIKPLDSVRLKPKRGKSYRIWLVLFSSTGKTVYVNLWAKLSWKLVPNSSWLYIFRSVQSRSYKRLVLFCWCFVIDPENVCHPHFQSYLKPMKPIFIWLWVLLVR